MTSHDMTKTKIPQKYFFYNCCVRLCFSNPISLAHTSVHARQYCSRHGPPLSTLLPPPHSTAAPFYTVEREHSPAPALQWRNRREEVCVPVRVLPPHRVLLSARASELLVQGWASWNEGNVSPGQQISYLISFQQDLSCLLLWQSKQELSSIV